MATEVNSENFMEILKNDGYEYVLKSKSTEPIDKNFPNLPNHHKRRMENDSYESELPDANVFHFEYNGSSYKILRNMGDLDCNDGNFGVVFDGNNVKVLDIKSSGDMETTMKSLKTDDKKISDDLQEKLSPYLLFFDAVLHNHTELEYVVFKVLVENGCFYSISAIFDKRA